MAGCELLFAPAHIYFPDLHAVVAWCGLLLFGLLLLYAWRGGHDFLIVINRGKVSFKGKFPASKRADIAEFLLKDLKPQGKMRISGKWTERRVLRVSVAGPIQEGQRQQIRNYIKLSLHG